MNDNTAIMSLRSIELFGVATGNATAKQSIAYAVDAISTLAKVRVWLSLVEAQYAGDIDAAMADGSDLAELRKLVEVK